MKKFLFFFLTSLIFNQIQSQTHQISIDWEAETTLIFGNSSKKIPGFDKTKLDFDAETGLWYVEEWGVSNEVDVNSVELINIRYQPISRNELKDLPEYLIPDKLKYSFGNSNARGKKSVSIKLSPIIKNSGIFQKITSVTISYKSSPNSATRMRGSNALISSALATGQWFKFYIEESGVFRITRSFLDQLGVDVNNVDPRNIGIYGYGGAMLPLANDAFYPNDLIENSIQFVGEEDGRLDSNDHILFYGQGPHIYNEESITFQNLYTDKTYYYIYVGNKAGKRIQNRELPAGTPTEIFTTFHETRFHENDEFNLINIGRRWFGDRFDSSPTKEFNFSFPNRVTTSPISFRILAAAVSDVNTSMQVRLNGNQIANLNFQRANEPVLAGGSSYAANQVVQGDDVNVNLNYINNGNPSSLAFLDFISIKAERQLIYSGNPLEFYNDKVANTPGIVSYNLSNATSVSQLWDITDRFNVNRVIESNGEGTIIFNDYGGDIKRYFTVDPSGYLEPLRDSQTQVANQDLKGTIFLNSEGNFQDVDYIIVTPDNLSSQAERLADINRVQNGLNVKVVTLESIYSEFSSGNQDIAAIRNFIKYVYFNASSPDKRLKYICLFGDASYDYKDRVPNNTNIVPSWHAYSSFSLTSAFVSDDFYGMMDPNEGNLSSTDRLDIAVGRMLVNDISQAREMVDKVKLYYEKEAYGSWRNKYVVISDDVDEEWERILQETTDKIANELTSQLPFMNVVKIHMDAFQQQSSSSGDRYPEVTEATKDAIEVGAIAVNYFGHGGEDGLAKERIFDRFDAEELRNICKFNCFITVTCEYTRFDNPQRTTAGELTYWNSNGGAIGLITTTRQIFVTVGVSLNEVLEDYLFSFGTSERYTMAEALRLTKVDPGVAGLSQKRLVFFIGDPAMKLAIPKPDIRLTSVNGNTNIGNETLKALDKITMSGEITDPSGNLLDNFNGTLTATIFDKEISRSTLANDGTTDNQANLIKLDFKTLGEIIFKGDATVESGKFNFDFVVPRDIGIPIGMGKASFYAMQLAPLNDKSGANFQINVGGINDNAEEDNTGPTISLYMNDENFVSGGITNESPTLLVKLFDEHGINTASGIGHDIVAIIDGDETNPIILNEYYKADVDDFTNGSLAYALRDLEPGLHTLTIKAWDVYNNSSTAEIQFIVHDEDEELVINNVLNYPNPFIDYTEFWFNHNSSGVLDVSIQIFTVSGKLVRTLNGQTSGGLKQTSSLSKDIAWDGRDDFGQKIGKGVYIYKLKVKSPTLNKQVEKIEKLVILQ